VLLPFNRNVRTLKKPHQQIPLFDQLVDLLMQPNALNVRLNVRPPVPFFLSCCLSTKDVDRCVCVAVRQIDLKPNNDIKVFELMKEIIQRVPNWQTDLAPRIVLGLWYATIH
jgi:phosphatidylglycerol phospholipase C